MPQDNKILSDEELQKTTGGNIINKTISDKIGVIKNYITSTLSSILNDNLVRMLFKNIDEAKNNAINGNIDGVKKNLRYALDYLKPIHTAFPDKANVLSVVDRKINNLLEQI